MKSILDRVTDWPERARACKFSAAALATRCGVGLRQLERFFLVKMGMSPQKWLHRERMARALLLLQADKNVNEVAGELGYEQRSHFSRAFRAYYGVPPSRAALPGPGAAAGTGTFPAAYFMPK